MIPSAVTDVLEGRSRYALLCCDGFALARELGAGAVDHVIGDPPYDEQTHAGAFSFNGRTKKAAPVCGTGIDFAALPPVKDFLPALLTCARRWVVLFCALEQLGGYKAVAGDHWIRSGVWARTTGTPQLSGDRPAQGAEGLAICSADGDAPEESGIAIMHTLGRKRWNGGGKRALWYGGRCQDPTRKHSAKKPAWLMESLVRDFCDPNDVIADFTAGESSTGEACYRLGLRYIGCEIDPVKHQWGVERMARAERAGVQMALPDRPRRMKQEALFR